MAQVPPHKLTAERHLPLASLSRGCPWCCTSMSLGKQFVPFPNVISVKCTWSFPRGQFMHTSLLCWEASIIVYGKWSPWIFVILCCFPCVDFCFRISVNLLQIKWNLANISWAPTVCQALRIGLGIREMTLPAITETNLLRTACCSS